MARLLALEWDQREARIAVAVGRGDAVVLEQAFRVALPQRAGDDADAPARVGAAVAAALAREAVRGGEALVALGRASIELRRLTLPPAPDDELIPLVRWQALREFHAIDESWTVDFLPLADEPGGPRNVLAAAVAPELLATVDATCREAGLKPKRLALRPCAAASLFLRHPDSGRHRVRLLVDVLPEEADLTVLVGDGVVFLRTARLPAAGADEAESARALVGEVRRTLAAAQNQLGGQRIEAVYVCGRGPSADALVERLAGELTIPVEGFDPLSVVRLGPKLLDELPAEAGRFAPLVGLLVDELAGQPPAIDFLNPRRPAPPPDRRPLYALAGVAAMLLVAAIGGFIWQRVSSLDRELDRLAAESRSFDPLLADVAALEQQTAELRAWQRRDTDWLAELARTSAKLPSNQDVVLSSVRGSAAEAGGQLSLEGRVRESGTVDRLEAALRDERHAVEGRGRAQDPKADRYRWQFRSTILVEPER